MKESSESGLLPENQGGGIEKVENKEEIQLEWGDESPEALNWTDARLWCESLGEGWRLPTSAELKAALESKIPGFREGFHYWTAYYYGNSRSWFGYTGAGEIKGDYDTKDTRNSARPVKGAVK